MPEKPLDGQTALVTGSSRGLGRVMAEELCRLGARVAVHGSRADSPKTFGEGESMQQVADDIARSCQGETMPVWGDVTSESEVRRFIGEVQERWEQVDILVCCAGGDIGSAGTSAGRGGRPDNDDCLSISLDDLRSVMDRNLLGTVLCCREVAPGMMERRSGRIITIGSIAGSIGRDDGSIYGVAKAAVAAYTRNLAVQLRPHNIPVNCVAPGGTVTARFLVIHDIEQRKLVEEGTLDRYGRPDEIASLVAYLCSEEAQFLSGQVIRADGATQSWPA